MNTRVGNSLTVQWLGLRTSTAGDKGSILGWGTNIPHATQSGKNNNNKMNTIVLLQAYNKRL